MAAERVACVPDVVRCWHVLAERAWIDMLSSSEQFFASMRCAAVNLRGKDNHPKLERSRGEAAISFRVSTIGLCYVLTKMLSSNFRALAEMNKGSTGRGSKGQYLQHSVSLTLGLPSYHSKPG